MYKMNNTVETIAQRLRELSDRTTDRHSRNLGSFNHLQQVESLAHDLRALTPENYVAAGALLFSPSVRYNALDYCDLALKSRELTKDLIDTRARLYEALAEFIARAGANGVQDHLLEIRKHTIDWLRNENSSKSKLSALQPLKACLRSKTISFTEEFDPAGLAALFKDRFSYGKATEFYSNGVKGALLTLLGMMCARFGSVFNMKDKNEPPTSKETLGGSIRRLCLFTLEEQYKGETKDPNPTLQAGALSGLRFTLEACPFETGSDSEEAKRIYQYIRAFMKAPPDMRRYEVPVQAILLLRYHANLLGPQLVNEAIQVFNDLRDLWARSDRIRKVASGACTAVLRVISKAVSSTGTDEDEDEGENNDNEDDESDDDDDEAPFRSQAKSAKVNVPVVLDTDTRKKILNVFMRRFFEFIQTALKSGGAEPDRDKRKAIRNDVDLAIAGFGLFSQAVVALIDEKRLRQVLDKLFELSDRLNAAEDEFEEVGLEEKLDDGSVSTRPEWMRRNLVNEKTKRRVRFLTTYASMAKYLAVESLAEDSIISRFANEIIELSRHLRIFPPYLTLNFTSAVSKLLRALANRGSAMQNLLSKIIHPVLMQSIGSSTVLEDQDTIVFDQFWKHLLPNKTDERKAAENDNISTNLLTKTLVFDHLLAVSLKLLSRLNVECKVLDQVETIDDMQPSLTSTSTSSSKSSEQEEKEQKKDDESFLTSSSAAMIHSVDRIVPNSIDDLVVLHNLTRLFERVMPHCHPSHLISWLPLYSRNIVQGLERNPLLSGWYWLMSLGFVALDQIASQQDGALTRWLDGQTEQGLDDFIETSALRSKQYRDELLAASLSCVIKAPRGRLLDKHIRSLVPCMVAALRMGLSYPPIAKEALNELERWIIVIPAGILVPLYPVLLQELSGYLSSAGGKSKTGGGTVAQQQAARGTGEEDDADGGEEGPQLDESITASKEEDEDLKRQWLVSQSKSRKQALKSARRHLNELAKNGEDDLSLGLRAVRILGRIGGNSRFVIPPVADVLKDARRWDPVPRLDVSLHLGSFVVPVFLDAILPRATHLARTSMHRQTKVAACELLHTLVIVMVGSSSSEQSKSGDHFSHLYTHLIPELLRLAVDVEPVAKQLFRPLIAQLARWFSRDLSVERPETIVLLDAAIDALSDHSNGSLRELAADTLAVFFRWTLKSASGAKGTAKKQRISVSSSLNVQTMLHRLYALMRHPDPFKRLGSALAFGAIYKDFREENSLVSEHALQLLENGVIALRMADADSEALGTRQAASEVAMRVLRIINQKASELVEEKEDRVGFTSLKEAVEWLFTMCHAREPLLRSRTQEMFQVLAPHIMASGKNPLHDWFTKYGHGGTEAISSDLKHISTLDDVHKLEEATAFIDFHLWLVRTRMIEKDQKDSLSSAFRMIDQLMSLILSKAEKAVEQDSGKVALLPHRSSLALAKLSRIAIEFMTQNIHQALKQYESTVEHTLKSGSLLLLRPQLMGMDAEEREIKMLFPPAFQRLIGAMDKEGKMSLVSKSIASLVSSNAVLVSKIDLSDPDSASTLRGLVHLVRSGAKLADVDKRFDLEQFARRIQQLKPGSGPLTLRNGSSALRLCLEAGLDRSFVVQLALNTTPVESNTNNDDGPKVGAVFMEHFEEEIIRHLVREPNGLISILLSKIDATSPTGTNASSQAFRLLNSLCDQLVLNGTKHAISSFVAESIPKLKAFCGDSSNLELVQVVAKILQLLTMVESKVRSSRIDDALDTTVALLKNAAKRASASHAEVLALRIAIIRGCIPPLLSGAFDLGSSEARAANLSGGLNFGLHSQSAADVYPLVLPSHESKVLEFLEKDIVSAYFPPSASRMSSHTTEADAYLKVLSAMFDVLSTTGSVGMLRILFRAIREFEADIHRDAIAEGLKKFAARVDCQVYEPSKDHIELPCMDIIAECVRSLLKDAPDFAKHSRLPVFNLAFVSIAQRLSSKAWEILLTTKGRICGKDNPDQTILSVLLGVVENPLESEPSKQCAFTAFRSLYESAQVDTLQTIQKMVFPPDKDKPAAPSNKLTTELSKHAVQVLSTAAKRVLHGKRDFSLESGSNNANSWGNNPPGGAARGQDLVRALSASELYHNAVYSCLVAVVCRTQSKVNIYEKLLFGETVSDWWHVLIPMRVDAATEPAYSVENPARPSTTIRSRLTMSGLLEEHQVATRRLTTSGISTSSATQLFSSLAVEDDSLRSAHESAAVEVKARPPVPVFSSGSTTTTTTTTTFTTAEPQQPLSERERQCLADELAPLELDAINSLPAMTALLTTLDSCRRKKIIMVEGDIGSQSSSPIPSWARMVLDAIKDIRGLGGDARQSLNIRIFGARAVLNRPSLFEPWARQLVTPLMQLCLDMETPYVEDPSRTRGLHSFLMEVMQLLLVWDVRNKNILKLDSENLNAWRLASRLVSMLARLSPSNALPVMRANVQLVSALISVWKGPRLEIQGTALLTMCRHEESSGRESSSSRSGASIKSCGLSLFLANAQHYPDLPLIPTDVSEADFFDTLFDILKRSRVRMVRSGAADVLALALAGGRYPDRMNRLHEIVDDLQRMDDEHDKWLEICATMATSQGAEALGDLLTRGQINRLQGILSRLEGDFLRMGMQIIVFLAKTNKDKDVTCAELYRSIVPVLNASKVLSPTNPHVGSVIGTLEAVELLTRVAGDKNGFLPAHVLVKDGWIDSIFALATTHASSRVREKCLQYLARLAKDHPDHLFSIGRVSSSQAEEEEDEETMRLSTEMALGDKVRCILLAGLSDPNPVVQKRVFEIWDTDDEHLPGVSPLARLVSCLSSLAPSNEWFVSTEAGSKILRRVESNWASQVAQLILVLSRRSPEYDNIKGSLLFKDPLDASAAPGQAVDIDAYDFGSMRASDSLVQPLFVSSQATMASQYIVAASSQAVGGGDMLVKATQQANLQFAPTQQPMGMSASGGIPGAGPSMFRLPPVSRLLSQTQSNVLAASRPRPNQPTKRRVVVLRRYKKGELPDIQIPRRDLMEPLLALCGLDAQIAEDVLTTLSRALFERAMDKTDQKAFFGALSPDREQILATTRDSLSVLLQSASKSRGGPDTSYVSCLLDMSSIVADVAFSKGITNNLEVSSHILGMASLAAGSLAKGVTNLESIILRAKTASEPMRGGASAIKHGKKAKADAEAAAIAAQTEEEAWDELLALYERLNDEDILSGLIERASQLDETRRAIQLEMAGEQTRALKLYKDILARDVVSSKERVLAWSGRSRSLYSLRRWDDCFKEMAQLVREVMESEKDYQEKLGEDDLLMAEEAFFGSHQNRALKRQLKQFVGSGVRSTEHQAFTIKFVDQCLQETSTTAFLESQLPQELILAELCRKQGPNWGQAQKTADSALRRFLIDYGAQSDLATTARFMLLRPLQPLTEFVDAFEARRQIASNRWTSPAPMEKVLSAWETSSPSPTLDSISLEWEAAVMNRTLLTELVYTDAMNAQVGHSRGSSSSSRHASSSEARNIWEDFKDRSERMKLQLVRETFDAALIQNRLDEAHSVMEQLRGMADKTDSTSARDRLQLALNDMHVDYILADKRGAVDEHQFKLGRAFERLKKHKGDSLDYLHRISRVAMELSLNGNTSVLDDAFGYLGQTVTKLEEIASSSFSSANARQLAQARYDLGSFAEKMLGSQSNCDELAEVAVKNLLSAMRMGHGDAINTFPSLLSLVVAASSSSKQRKTFESLAPDCATPTVLLRWTAQLLSFVEQSDLVDDLLIALAKTFPQSIYYPFRVAREALEERGSDPKVWARMDKLERAMNLPPVVKEFCNSLENLNHPELRLKDACKSIGTLLGTAEKIKASDSKESAAILKTAKEMYRNKIVKSIFEVDAKKSGSYNVEFAKKYKDGFVLSEKDIKWTSAFFTQLAHTNFEYSRKPGKQPLATFSRWLDGFAIGLDPSTKGELEVPGWRDPWHASMNRGSSDSTEYENGGAGIPSESDRDFYLVKSFDSDVLQLSSMRVPKRLTMRGVDGKRRDFLVKGGEDLRLDERIEQIFSFMNSLMEVDGDCAKRNLKIQTYRVIPVSLSIGLIEWVPDSEPVRNVIVSQGRRSFNMPSNINEWSSAKVADTWYKNYRVRPNELSPNVPKLYAEPDDICAEAYREMTSRTPADLLRRHFVSISSGAEAFLALRQVFAQSLASISISCYVLGIGDRHLENFLLGPCGDLIAIDFGYSFGIGVAMLPVPETTPFRFTPQFSQFFAPLDSKGTFFQCSTSVMQCLRSNRRRVMDVLDVFVKEPLVDWVQQAQILSGDSSAVADSSGHSSSSEQEAWRPLVESRVRVADLKMRGVRPSLVMTAELKERRSKKGLDSVIGAVCRASGEDKFTVQESKHVSLRDGDSARWIVDPLSVHDQIAELVRMATEPALLARQWQMAYHWL